MRFRSTHWRKESRLCGPSLLMVRSPMPPPAVVTAMCSPPRASMACSRTFSVPSKSVTSTSWKVPPIGVGDFLALRLRPVQHRHAGAALGQRLCGRLAEARRPADDDGLLARDLHLAPFPKSARFVKQPSRCHFSVRLSGGRMGSLASMAASGTRAMAGIAAAAVALGVTQLLAAFVGPAADSRTAVGSAVIDLTPGPGQGMGDPDVRHGRQARAVGAGAGGDRRHRRGRRLDGDAPRPDRQRGDRPRRGGRMRGGAVPRGRDGRWTSCPPSSARCAASRCCGC